MGFKEYVMTRKRGRGPASKVAWDFMVDARSDDRLADAKFGLSFGST